MNSRMYGDPPLIIPEHFLISVERINTSIRVNVLFLAARHIKEDVQEAKTASSYEGILWNDGVLLMNSLIIQAPPSLLSLYKLLEKF